MRLSWTSTMSLNSLADTSYNLIEFQATTDAALNSFLDTSATGSRARPPPARRLSIPSWILRGTTGDTGIWLGTLSIPSWILPGASAEQTLNVTIQLSQFLPGYFEAGLRPRLVFANTLNSFLDTSPCQIEPCPSAWRNLLSIPSWILLILVLMD